MARWGFDEREMVMAFHKPGNYGTDLIQNCDLPPPMKLFSGYYDKKTVISCINNREKACTSLIIGNHDNDHNIEDRDGKMGLLRALRLSQTRAREAQTKCESITKERDSLALALMKDSMQLFGYQQLVRLLEFQVSTFEQQRKKMKKQLWCELGKREKAQGAEEDGSGDGGLSWIMAVAFCLGIASFGFALAWNYY